MSEFDKIVKELVKELKKNDNVQNGPNAAEYMKFLKKALEKTQSFNSENENYVNYAIGGKSKAKKATLSAASPIGKLSNTANGDGQKIKKAKNPNKDVKK